MAKNSLKAKPAASKPTPSSNWLALQKVLRKAPMKRAHAPDLRNRQSQDSTRKRDSQDFPRKRRKIESSRSPSPPVTPPSKGVDSTEGEAEEMKNGESLPILRRMIFGGVEYTDAQRLPGKYLALDCEMVGVGPEGIESALARVSIVNFHGAVQLDAFVRPREHVIDYRTEWSGIREADMVHARPFEEVQAQAAALIKDRVLVGHAVFNDLKALLLSHPRPHTRDTQVYAGRFKVSKSKYVALRNLVKQEVGAVIQGGEHSSVTDARATMAVYRLHRREWEKGSAPLRLPTSKAKQRRTADEDEEEGSGSDDDEPVKISAKGQQKEKPTEKCPGGGRKGVSSGLSAIVRRVSSTSVKRGAGGQGEKDGGRGRERTETEWWKELGGSKAKTSIRV
ncbi:ribonuclease H-like domain-containing protein [Mycena maculata]|uniref:RNA exonuclease 4 n=1 Tax=Mycena maculata TaxID=230809 RepID=A0AAD7HAF3_9AGAR|nr:ribonuclease H-like domain-containing protein [Mycena maculata]